jgi:hypothetical protein
MIVWNQTRKRDRWGQHRQQARPNSEWLRVPAPAVRIVSEDLWRTAHTQLSTRRRHYAQIGISMVGEGRARGRTRRDADVANLLTGFARRGVCGGGLNVHTRQHGGHRVPFYGCLSHWKRGPRVCGNRLLGRAEVMDAEVLATLQDDVLRPAVVERAVRLALAELAPARQTATQHRLARELATVRAECERLADAIARGGALDVLLERLQARQARRMALEAELAVARAHVPTGSADGLERRLRAKLADWRALLTRNVSEGRAVLRTLLVGPLRFTPVEDERRRGYRFEGLIALDRLLAGAIDLPHVARPQRDSRPVGCGEPG